MKWIRVCSDAPYFETEDGEPWTPIGQNDAVPWPDLAGLFRRRDLESVEAYFDLLKRHRVTCLRLMLEYCHREHRYLEKPVGIFAPNMVRLWDDLFALCEKYDLRVLLTPYDTFWMWIRWAKHPYNRRNGGMCDMQLEWLTSPEMRAAIKNRLEFVTTRWGASGALFAWDLWNEIHPAHAQNSTKVWNDFVSDIGGFLRQTEERLHGRAHPQTVSIFGPVLLDPKHAKGASECVFRHPKLDFASVHFYETNTIDDPRNTVDVAVSVGRLTRDALAQIEDHRPFFDSEHGPIHRFKDHRNTLPEAFDDEYFRHIQWAHFASGGAGGAMRWPNRHPHCLTPGMRLAQRSLAEFLPLLDWNRFGRRNLNEELKVDADFHAFGCGDDDQALVYLLRRGPLEADSTLCKTAPPLATRVRIPGLRAGRFRVTAWNTVAGCVLGEWNVECCGDCALEVEAPPVVSDVALAVRRVD